MLLQSASLHFLPGVPGVGAASPHWPPGPFFGDPRSTAIAVTMRTHAQVWRGCRSWPWSTKSSKKPRTTGHHRIERGTRWSFRAVLKIALSRVRYFCLLGNEMKIVFHLVKVGSSERAEHARGPPEATRVRSSVERVDHSYAPTVVAYTLPLPPIVLWSAGWFLR